MVRLSAAAILAVVLLIRLPFLNQAIQGDDGYYLAEAAHAQIDPLHPNHVQYVFSGRTRGSARPSASAAQRLVAGAVCSPSSAMSGKSRSTPPTSCFR